MNLVRLAQEAMRTRFEIVLWDTRLSPADLRAAGEEALKAIAQTEAWLSAYRPDSDLFHVNASAANHPVRVDARVFRLLQRAQELTLATEGAFDMTVGPLLRLWQAWGEAGEIPPPSDIERVCTLVGMEAQVWLDEDTQTVAFAASGVCLDPGAIGKGFALDRAAALLREAGVENALLQGGTSTVLAWGTAPNTPDGWRVAVQHPLRADQHMATVVLREGMALSVSAVHGKTFWAQGRRFGHIVDPRTGQPVEKTLLAAVVSQSATESDALSTALLVIGDSGLPSLTKRFPRVGFLVAATADKSDTALCITVEGSSTFAGVAF